MSDFENALNTIDQIYTLINNLNAQCKVLDKENKDDLIKIKQQIKKMELDLSLILPDTKLPIGSIQNGSNDDKLKARAARFGCVSDSMKKISEDEKLENRKKRFNLNQANSANGSTSDEAKKRRLARFAN